MKKITYIVGLVAIVLIAGSLSVANFGSKQNTQEVASEEASATVAIESVEPIKDAAALGLVNGKTISWETSGFEVGSGVDINLIKKVSDSPVSYVFVRKIAENTTNDGSETWTPSKGDIGNDIYVEVTCASNTIGSCKVSGNPIRAN